MVKMMMNDDDVVFDDSVDDDDIDDDDDDNVYDDVNDDNASFRLSACESGQGGCAREASSCSPRWTLGRWRASAPPAATRKC